MLVQTFRYDSCGGATTFLGLFLYYTGYQFLFARKIFDIGFMSFKPHIAALLLSSVVTFCVGFLLNKYVVFTGSNLKGRIQLFRYFLSFAFNLVLNYLMLKLLVDLLKWDALLSQLITTTLVITASYLSQKHYSTKIKKTS